MGIRRLLVAAALFSTVLVRPAAAATGETFTVTSLNDSGGGTLRQAILGANGNANAPLIDRIEFAVSGSTPLPISLTTALPDITEPVVIDGYTQGDATPGVPADDARPNDEPSGSSNAVIKIRVDGFNTAGVNGFVIASPDVVIRGLAITDFDLSGIRVDNGKRVRIEGNFIGSSTTGTTALGNAADGVSLSCPGASGLVVGGTAAAARNLISGNTGEAAVDTGETGCRNVSVTGNLIGTEPDGATSLANTGDGVLIRGTPKAAITIASNVIAHNGLNGVDIAFGGSGHRILGNAIFENGALGIDLEKVAFGVTPNDHLDKDGGPNHQQNFPEITLAHDSGTQLEVKGFLDSRPNRKYLIQFFGSTNQDPSTFGEGERFIGQKSVATNGAGKATFHVFLNHPAPGVGFATTTATDKGTGDTSEFSQAVFIP